MQCVLTGRPVSSLRSFIVHCQYFCRCMHRGWLVKQELTVPLRASYRIRVLIPPLRRAGAVLRRSLVGVRVHVAVWLYHVCWRCADCAIRCGDVNEVYRTWKPASLYPRVESVGDVPQRQR
ncbi:hypothetical protein L227DRAFT_374553 [Lentinus tigrinus ALCF2SS1-6]|uniref:Uncharacterized protein n=1 Tax=Lentinus tigrinus ALCF2SS1-6 TaxID=1328759 RepID=A0A5C2RUX4_9APHY|nr:hypothetical protein L227DRAFT_374553 [Lentinus tigrinus ALCF2SS1-6]